MARARNIKPSFFTNDELAELPFGARLLFIGLWTLADREGRLEDRPKKIKMQLFPADDIDIDASLDGLARAGLVIRYHVEGSQFIQVTNFVKHQNPHHKEVDSVIPPPPVDFDQSKSLINNDDVHACAKHDSSMTQACPKLEPSKSPLVPLIPDSLIPDSLIPDSGSPQHDTAALKSCKPRRPKPPAQLPEWMPGDTWEAFVRSRKALKKPMTDDAQRLALMKLDRMRQQGQDPVEVVNQSVVQGWIGLFDVKPEAQQQGQPLNKQQALEQRNMAIGLAWAQRKAEEDRKREH